MNEQQYLNRKDIARLLEISYWQVMRNEQELGLTECKVALNKKFIRYKRNEALAALRTKGYNV